VSNGRAGPGIATLLRRPVPRLLWAGQVTSVAGDRLYAIALIWVALQLTGGAGGVAIVSAAATVPFLLASLFSGWFADRRDGLRVAPSVDLARAAAVAMLPVLYLLGELSLPALACVACVLSALDAFFLPALQASLPRLVEPAALTPMVSLLDSTDRLGRVLGPAAVGLLVALPQVHLFTVDAASFLVSAACLTAMLRRPAAGPRPATSPQEGLTAAALFAGWRATISQPVLRNALLLRTAGNLAWPAFTLGVPFLVAHRYRHGIGGYGLVLAAFGVGNLIGTVLAARVPRRRLGPTCCLAWAAAGISFAALAIAPDYGLFLAASAGLGVCTPLANVTVNAAVAASLPQDLLARAYAAQRIAVVAAGTAGLPVAAALISGYGPAATLYVAGSFILAAAALAGAATTWHPTESSAGANPRTSAPRRDPGRAEST
jgi:DHA3 family macrolide efflux protein-like MFS transporter